MGDSRHCTCLLARNTDGWCEHHQRGFVAGEPIRFAQLFETLDPHGHEIGLASITCERCREAIPKDERCEACQIGWYGGLAYMTRLTWLLAKGTRADPMQSLCARCLTAANSARPAEPSWCTTCGGGLVGNVFFDKPEIFDEARAAFAILRRAVGEADRCELCACAMVYDGTCPDCNITYVDGQPTTSDAN